MSPSHGRAGDLVFIGDVHLDRDDPHLEPFLEFLESLGTTASRIVLMGDLFNLWIGRPEMELAHHVAVVRKLRELRSRGLTVRYIEGNRDYRIGPRHAGQAFDDVTDRVIAESFGGRRIVAVHGDLANRADRRYRAWRRISRSTPAWALFNLLPRSRRLQVAENLEHRLRRSNPGFKSAFPEAAVRDYAKLLLGAQDDALVLGHFHLEKDLHPGPDGPHGRILVLPEWKQTRRHLRVTEQGEIDFVDS